MEHEIGQQDANATGLARRTLVAAGLSGVAITLAPLLQQAASASTPPGSSGSSSGSGAPSSAESTTTTAPQRPTADDVEALAAAQSLELAAAALYAQALAKPGDDSTKAVLSAIRDNHAAYAQAISGLLGRAAPGTVAQSLVDELTADFTGDSKAMLQAGYTLEADLAQTHVESIAKLGAVSGAQVLASIAVIEGRHGTVLADLSKQTDLNDLLSPEGKALSVKG